jgi:hypothetical protein
MPGADIAKRRNLVSVPEFHHATNSPKLGPAIVIECWLRRVSFFGRAPEKGII